MVHHVHGGRAAPPADHGRDQVVAHGQRHGVQCTEDLHAVRVHPGLLVGLPQCRPDMGCAHAPAGHVQEGAGFAVGRIEAPAREGHLAGMGTQGRGALDEQHVQVTSRPVRVLGIVRGHGVQRAEEDEHRGVPVVLVQLADPPRFAVVHDHGITVPGELQELITGVGPVRVGGGHAKSFHAPRVCPSARSSRRVRPARKPASSSSRPGASS